MGIVRLFLLLAILGGIFYAVLKFVEYANTPATTRSKSEDLRTILGGRAVREVDPTKEGNKKFDGKYMTFVYPAAARRLEPISNIRGVLERVDLEMRDPRLSIVAVASEVTERYIDEVTGVNFRRLKKDEFSESSDIIGPNKTPVFTKIDGTEKTAFILYNGRLYTISISGSNKLELARIWNRVLPTFRFI